MACDELNIPTEKLPADLEAAFDRETDEALRLNEAEDSGGTTAPYGWTEV